MSTKDEVLAKQQKLAAQAVLDNSEIQPDGTVLIGDVLISGTVETNNPDTPSEDDYLFAVKYGTDNSKRYVRYSVKEILAALGQDVLANKQAAEEAASLAQAAANSAEDIKNYVEQAEQGAVEGISTAKEDALNSISQTSSDALTSISTAKEEAMTSLENRLHVGYRTVIGDGVTKSFTITHNLNSEWVFCQVWFTDLSAKYYYRLQEVDSNSIRIDFDFAPLANSVDVRIVPNVRIETPEGGTGTLPEDFKVTQNNIDESVECSEADIAELLSILG